MAQQSLLPVATLAATNVALSGAASAHDCLNDPVGTPDDGATFVRGATVGTSDVQLNAAAFVGNILAINWIEVHFRSQDATGGGAPSHTHTPYIVTGGVQYNGNAAALPFGFWADFATRWTTNPGTGVPWTKSDLNPAGGAGFIFGYAESAAVDRGDCTQIYVLVDYRPVPSGQNAVRNIASQIVRRRRNPIPSIKTTSPLNELLDLQIGDNLSLIHEALRSTDGSAASLRDWKTHLVRLDRRRILPSTRTMELSLTQQREFLATFWYGARSLTSVGIEGEGVALLTTGGAVTYLRNSLAWYEDPITGIARQFSVDELGYPRGGILHEPADTNFLLRSSFVSQLTGLTALVGTNGGTRAAVAPVHPLFEPTTSAWSGRLTYGTNVTSATNGWQWPDVAALTFAANQRISVSVDHEDSASGAGDNLKLEVVRLLDGFYWNEGTRAWQAGVVATAVPFSVGARARYSVRDVNVGAAATGLRVSVYQAVGGTTISRWNEVHHLQVSGLSWVGSRIVTDAAQVTRALTSLKIAHTAAKPVLRNAGFTFLCYYTPEFNQSELSGVQPIWHLQYSSNDAWRFRYSAGNSRFEAFTAEHATPYTAFSPTVNVVAGTRYALAVRVTSSAAEVGLAAHTVSVFLNGVKGTDAVMAADPVEASVDFILGDNAVNGTARGQIEPVLFTPVVLTDAEIGRLAGL